MAAQIDGAITDVTVTPAAAGPGDPIRVDVDWAVPASASGGDTFTLTLPPQLDALATSFQATTPGGAVVANATVVNGVVTFTLTDYADTHGALSGDAYFSTKWDLVTVPTEGPVSLDFTTTTQVFHDTVIKTPRQGTVDRTQPRKAGHWVVNGVTTGPDALQWVIDSPSGPFDRATFDDTPGPGQAIDCATLELRLGSGLDAGGNASRYRPLPAGQVISSTCSTSGLLVVAGPILADQIIRIRYAVDITDPTLPVYTNSVDVTVDSTEYRTVTDQVRVYDAGGHATDGPSDSPTTSPTTSPTSSTTAPTTTTSTTTAATTAPTVRPAVQPTEITARPSPSSLPFTGADVGPLLVLAALLLGGGVVLAAAGRGSRGRTTRRH